MSNPYTAAALALGAIKRGIRRLADRYPFHAAVLAQLADEERVHRKAYPPWSPARYRHRVRIVSR